MQLGMRMLVKKAFVEGSRLIIEDRRKSGGRKATEGRIRVVMERRRI